MPTSTEVDYLDGEFTVIEDEPSNIAELIALIGEDAVVKECNANLRYRGKYPRVYKKVSAALESDHGFPVAVIKEETRKDSTIKKVKEAPMDHIRAAHTGRKDKDGNVLTPPIANADAVLQDLFTTHGQAEPIWVKGERAGGGGKVSAAALELANQFIAAGDAAVENVVGKVEANVPGYTVGRDADGNATPESLARGIQALNKHIEKQAKAQTLSMLSPAA